MRSWRRLTAWSGTCETASPDSPIGQRRLFDAFGNYIVLEVTPEEFLFIAHLQPRSIARTWAIASRPAR